MSKNPPLALLLATYNGVQYLEEQVRSLQAQTRRDWLLYACDDGSSDGTLALLERLAADDRRVVILRDPLQGRGAAARFNWLIEQVREQHQIFFFVDQDDVWHSQKIEKLASVIENADAAIPLLVHCDLVLVDQDLRMLNPSFFAHTGNDPRRARADELASNNTVTGCACAMNRALADLVLPMPAFGIPMMHDWWIAMVASRCGRIVTIPEALVFYRQHGRNTLGAGVGRARRRYSELSWKFIAERFSEDAVRTRTTLMLKRPLIRLQALQQRFGGLERPVFLLARGGRRDLLEFAFRYRVPWQSPLTSLIQISDILRIDLRSTMQA